MNHFTTTMCAALLFAVPALAQKDLENSKDHPLLTRVPGYAIHDYSQSDFDKNDFMTGDGTVTVEGRKTYLYYKAGADKHPSHLQIIRNIQAALAKIGGKTLYDFTNEVGGQSTVKVEKNGGEAWLDVRSNDEGANYFLTIVEKAGMKQEVVATAEVWKADLNTTGHAAVYGILFDTDKSEIKPASDAALKEIAKLLNASPKLSLLVVGHTDMAGDLAHNMKLSEARANAVVAALTSKHGIAAARLKGSGVGPLSPVASNDTEDGKAKNRRVELVKR